MCQVGKIVCILERFFFTVRLSKGKNVLGNVRIVLINVGYEFKTLYYNITIAIILRKYKNGND